MAGAEKRESARLPRPEMELLPTWISPLDRSGWFWPQRVPGLPRAARARIELELCAGVQPARSLQIDKGYSPTAYVPFGKWERVTRVPSVKVGATWLRNVVPRCGVFRLPGFDAALWVQITGLAKVDPKIFNRAIDRITNAIVADVDRLLGSMVAPVLHGFSTNEGNELTVTVDHKKLWRVGLHLDSWEAGGAEERDQALTRICINFGPGDRYFLFVPLTLRRIRSCLPRSVQDKCAGDFTRMISEFFRLYPNSPVMRLRVKPGWVYFADTDNMVHDASTTLIEAGNTHFTLRGRFQGLN